MLKNVKYFLLLNLLPPVIYLILTVLRMTLKMREENREPLDALWNRGEGSRSETGGSSSRQEYPPASLAFSFPPIS